METGITMGYGIDIGSKYRDRISGVGHRAFTMLVMYMDTRRHKKKVNMQMYYEELLIVLKKLVEEKKNQDADDSSSIAE